MGDIGSGPYEMQSTQKLCASLFYSILFYSISISILKVPNELSNELFKTIYFKI